MSELYGGVGQPTGGPVDDSDGLEFVVDAKATLAQALALNAAATSANFAKAAAWLRWALGPEAEPIIKAALDLKIRQNRSAGRMINKALSAIALEEKQVSLGSALMGGDDKK